MDLTTLLVTGASFGAENGGSYYGPLDCGQLADGLVPFLFIGLPIFLLALRFFNKKLGNRK